jgi:hypothetical protein
MMPKVETTTQTTFDVPVSDEIHAISISDRRTDELVIGFVGAIGSGVSTTARILAEILDRGYNYSSNFIKVSEIIRTMGASLGENMPDDGATNFTSTSRLQEIGNSLRKKYSNSYLAEKCVERISVDRLHPPGDIPSGYMTASNGAGNSALIPVNRRRVHLIDSIKHTSEVDLLREVYGDTFWLFGVFSPEAVRGKRLLRN